MAALPACPLTGEPALRCVHHLGTRALRRVWWIAGAGDISRLFDGKQQLGLYKSNTGLYFFHPAIPGDEAFYTRFYASIGGHKLINKKLMQRIEYRHAARLVRDGAKILDVGCGIAGLRMHVPQAEYVGLDPYAPPQAPGHILRETLAEHATRNTEAYDIVSAFQVIEHVADPLGFSRTLTSLLRPGGLLILCAPLHPSRLTEIPNFVLNLPPHHLTWWNTNAFKALAKLLNLAPVDISELPPSPHASIVDWMHRLSWARSDTSPECYFAHRWSWHLNLAACYGLGRAADALFSPPASTQPYDVFFAARKADHTA